MVPESPKVTQSHPFPSRSTIYIHQQQYLDLHECRGLSGSALGSLLVRGPCSHLKFSFYPGVVVLAKRAPKVIKGRLGARCHALWFGWVQTVSMSMWKSHVISLHQRKCPCLEHVTVRLLRYATAVITYPAIWGFHREQTPGGQSRFLDGTQTKHDEKITACSGCFVT